MIFLSCNAPFHLNSHKMWIRDDCGGHSSLRTTILISFCVDWSYCDGSRRKQGYFEMDR